MSDAPTGSDPRTYFRRSIDWFYGENAYLQQQVPKEVGEKHINELLGRHPWHPYSPSLSPGHPCFDLNAVFGECMDSEPIRDLELHLKHVNCYHPYKVDLMQCLTKVKRMERERQLQKESPTPAEAGDSGGNKS
jgi:hypothetical protein